MARLFQFISIPEAIQDKFFVDALKNRLDWGEPAPTIVDVRDINALNAKHITGACCDASERTDCPCACQS
ncbi:MAG: hypothetical protein LH702_14405 [Phormidesmis sp. CAN_BIN44]|nr:hypothetical protein [Phormidesmis sp. CAN_BIN44]